MKKVILGLFIFFVCLNFQTGIAQAEISWDWDSSLGFFNEGPVNGCWYSISLYPFTSEDVYGDWWSFGLNVTRRRWQGQTEETSSFQYDGDVDILSLAIRCRSKFWEIITRLGYGQRQDSGYLENQWGRYQTKQETDILDVYYSFEYNGRSRERWFSKFRGSIEMEWGRDEKTKEYWTDQWDGLQSLNGRTADKDKEAWHFGLYVDLLDIDQEKNVQLWTEGRTSYYLEDDKWSETVKLGLNFQQDLVKIGLGYNWSEEDDWVYAVYVEVNLKRVYQFIFTKKEP